MQNEKNTPAPEATGFYQMPLHLGNKADALIKLQAVKDAAVAAIFLLLQDILTEDEHPSAAIWQEMYFEADVNIHYIQNGVTQPTSN